MAQINAKHTHKCSIADDDAVQVLLRKLGAPNGSRNVDGERFYKALACVARRYAQSKQETCYATEAWKGVVVDATQVIERNGGWYVVKESK